MRAVPLSLPYLQLYDLYGVLVHHGHSVNSGHYICYVKAANGLWHLADDHRVTSVGEKVGERQKRRDVLYWLILIQGPTVAVGGGAGEGGAEAAQGTARG